MTLFSNDAVNRANLHSVISALAQGAGGFFIFVFLLKSGVSLPLVFCTMAAMTTLRFVLRPAVLPLVKKIGLRRVLMLGTVLEALVYLQIPFIDGPGVRLVVMIFTSAIGSVLYWTTYHAVYAALGDAEDRGSQVGLREALVAIAGVIAPALGGVAIAYAGPVIVFFVIACVQVLAAAPFIGALDVPVPAKPEGGQRERMFAAKLMASDGWLSASYQQAWQIALFVALGEAFENFGAGLALAGLVSAMMSFGIGRLIDLGHGKRAVIVSYSLGALALLAMAAAQTHPVVAIGAGMLGAFAYALMVPALYTPLYNLSKAAPCQLRFHIATEAGWDIGNTAGTLCAALFAWLSVPLAWTSLVGLFGLYASVLMLVRLYSAGDRVA